MQQAHFQSIQFRILVCASVIIDFIITVGKALR